MASAQNEYDERASALRVERAIVELRRGRLIDVLDGHGVAVVAAIERLDPDEVSDFVAADGSLSLVLTPERGEALGLAGYPSALEIALPGHTSWESILRLATGMTSIGDEHVEPFRVGQADSRAAAALTLARHAQIIPALAIRDPAEDRADLPLLQVSVDDIKNYPLICGREIQRVSRARVPLAASENCEFIVYRERFRDAEHVAIVIDTPDSDKPVPVRLHSACLTGDLLASLRCDCGDQLRGAVERIAKVGGGVVLYLAQEGRGIGLVNKLRAYALQEQGLDTLQADRHLGFRADERDYAVACAMLKDLGIDRVVLLTNNPNKMAALDVCEIEVVSRMPLPAPANKHNAHYLRTKREHAGHLAAELEGAENL